MKRHLVEQSEKLLAAARERKLKLATAESCTGGLIAAALTEIPGSSDVFERGFVTYSNEAKIDLLGVAKELIARHGAVSEAAVEAMALGALENSRAHLALAVSGIAGPEGGSADKPVGTVLFRPRPRRAPGQNRPQEFFARSRPQRHPRAGGRFRAGHADGGRRAAYSGVTTRADR